MNISLILFFALSMNAVLPPAPPQFRSIKLSEFTRGTMRMIEVTPKQRSAVYNSVTRTEVIDPKMWEKIVQKACALPLDDLKSVPITSKKHQVDAALHASLTFVMRDTTVFTPTFDHNAPPDAYKPLIDLLYQQVPSSLQERFAH
jgi:hypothetical protein